MTTVAPAPATFARASLRPTAVLLPFALFCAYALLRWQTMLPHMGWRPPALLAFGFVTAAVAGNATRLAAHGGSAGRSRFVRVTLSAGLILIAVTLLILIAGLPPEWVYRVRIALILRTIANGFVTIPTVTVPYLGAHRDVRVMITLTGGLLVLASALALHGVLAQDTHGETRGRQRRLTLAASLLLVMSLVPSVIVEPRYVLMHGMIAFALTVMLVYGWRIEKGRGLGALVLLAVTAACGAMIAGSVNPRHGLLAVNQIVSSLGSTKAAGFDWQQTYGPLGPVNGAEVVLEVQAAHAAHWKAENLDVFNGTRWLTAESPLVSGRQPANALLDVSKSSRRRWTQTLHVTDVDISTDNLIAAGTAQPPLIKRTIPGVMLGTSPGTWSLASPLKPGLKYSVRVYTPDPSPAQLQRTQARYPRAIRKSELATGLPHTARNPALGPVYALARKLKSGAHDPYQYVEAVYGYLHHGFTYVRNPPRSAEPIPDFLLHTKRGYCQQFAGAMALLLRIGGVPARVAVGFATGSADRKTRTYTVRANDAHAWAEAWFPHYGWVTFDPTPAVPRVRGAVSGGQQSRNLHGDHAIGGAKSSAKKVSARTAARSAQPVRHQSQATASGISAAVIVVVAVTLMMLLVAFLWVLRRPRAGVQDPGELTYELERAFARCGRPLKREVTLFELEASLQSASPAAAAYVRNLRLARYGPRALPPTAAQRRELRRWLSHGRGIRGHLRALLALPPSR